MDECVRVMADRAITAARRPAGDRYQFQRLPGLGKGAAINPAGRDVTGT